MKDRLIKVLFEEFENDKDIIKENLMKVMEIITLETEDEYGTLKMTIEYERKIENEFFKKRK